MADIFFSYKREDRGRVEPIVRLLEREGLKVWWDPDLAEQLRQSYDAIKPGYHLNKRHWNTVTLDGSLSDQMMRDMIEDSYDLVVAAMPRRVREALGWNPG